jgi:hypothetical protein
MPEALTAGQLVDERYALEEPLGSDAFGTIWRAHDRGLGRPVCLRGVRFSDAVGSDPDRRKDVLMAARKAIRVDHPGAIHLWDAFIDGDTLMIVTELPRGKTLEAIVRQKGRLAAKRAAAIGLDLLDPILAANTIGIPHGWITPAAAYLPEKAPAQLAEFGLAPSFEDTSAYSWVEMVGEAAYVAPEQASLRGSSLKSDLYSLGATLYFAVEGVPPFTARTTAAVLAEIRSDHARLMEKAGPLTGLIERLLSKQPDRRPDADEVRRKLAAVAGVSLTKPVEVEAEEVTPPAAPPAPPRRRARKERHQAEPEPEEERDWNRVLDAGAIAGADDQWVDWSAGGADGNGTAEASDVWLPGTEIEVEPPPPQTEVEVAEAEVAEADAPAEVAEAEGVEAPADVAGEPEPAEPAPVTVVPTAAAVEEEEPPRRYRSTPSWPPPQGRRSLTVTLLCALVMVVMVALLITNGRLFGRSREAVTESRGSQDRPVLATDPSSVPANWITYRHAAANYGISYPPGWSLREEGSLVVIRDAPSSTELRIDYKQPPGPDPEKTWLELEADFSSRHPGDYRRLQLSPASYLGYVAALWEFTFNDNNVPTHAVDLGFLTKKYGFALYFQAPSAQWQATLPTFYAFLSSFQPPK